MPRISLIGAGAFTEYCLQAYSSRIKNLEIVGIYDPNQDRSQLLAKKFGIATVAESAEELLGTACDVVVILTPPNTHFAYAKQALLKNKNILVEKPVAFHVEEAQELYDIAKKSNLKMTANFVLRFHPGHEQIRQFSAGGTYGKLLQITSTALLAEYPSSHWYWDQKISGGFFLNTFCHFIDLFDFIHGGKPNRICSYGKESNGYVITSTFSDGLVSNLSANLHVTNQQEDVATKYIFDSAIITTNGWLPSEMSIQLKNGKSKKVKFLKKDKLYQDILAQILKELFTRIENPKFEPVINNDTLRDSVFEALLASKQDNL